MTVLTNALRFFCLSVDNVLSGNGPDGFEQRLVILGISNAYSNVSRAVIPILAPSDRDTRGLTGVNTRLSGVAAIDPEPRGPRLTENLPIWIYGEDTVNQILPELRSRLPRGLQVVYILDCC